MANKRDTFAGAQAPDTDDTGVDATVAGTAADGIDEASANTPISAEASAAQDDPVVRMLEDVEQLQQDLVDAKEQALRAAAEMQNVRKRAERDVENAHKYGQEKLIAALLPVLDNLDRALDAAQAGEGQTGAADPAQVAEQLTLIIEGVELTRKSALDALKQFSVEVLEPYGEPFDPQLHEAMTMIESDTVEPNSVIDVLQKGYRLHGRLLRAAMVVVAKG